MNENRRANNTSGEHHAEEHLKIAELAMQLGFADVRAISKTMLAIPERYESQLPWTTHRIWVEDGPLDETEWHAIQKAIRRENQERDIQRNGPPEDDTWNRNEQPTHHDQKPPAEQLPNPADNTPYSGDTDPQTEGRYIVGSLLGKGGAGRVYRAYDRTLHRVVALKVPQNTSNLSNNQRFIDEAHTTSQLEHPNIIPIYDLGVLASGEHFYTMKRISGRSLRDVLRARKAGRNETLKRWTEDELLRVFIEVCLAIEYAHHRHILHRDIKPENIMLGEFGEVWVMDWGLAQRNEDATPNADPDEQPTVGTPAYMSPEQAQGKRDLDQRSDVYSLGVILYEILTLTVPSRRDTVFETLLAVSSDPIPPPSRVAFSPLAYELDEVVMRALARPLHQRYPTVRQLREDVAVYLNGRRPRNAQRAYRQAEELLVVYDQAAEELEALRRRAGFLAARLPDDASLDERRDYWRAEDRAKELALRQIDRFDEITSSLLHALRLNPDFKRASEAIASLNWRRYVQAERDHNQQQAHFYATVVRQFDVRGHYTNLLDSPTTLDVHIDDAGYQVFLQTTHPQSRQLFVGSANALGEAPLQVQDLPRGSWLLSVKKIGRPILRIPLFARADSPVRLSVETQKAHQIPPGFVFANRGDTIIGGDLAALDPLPYGVAPIDTFVASFFHVTLTNYLHWIQYLDRQERGLAEAHLPILSNGAPLIRRFDNGEFQVCPAALRFLAPAWHTERDYPVVGIRAIDAQAYIAWRSHYDGRAYRLPTETEYERMARGADGRIYPWGEHFDPALCSMLLSSPSRPHLRSTGAFPTDVGPFGHRDLAGNVREFCTAEKGTGVVLKGGSWMSDETACRAASRIALDADRRRDDVSFRLAYSP